MISTATPLLFNILFFLFFAVVSETEYGYGSRTGMASYCGAYAVYCYLLDFFSSAHKVFAYKSVIVSVSVIYINTLHIVFIGI